MMNNVENKNDLNKMSDLEFGKNKVEMMRYRDNSLSYKLGLGAIAFSVLGCFICLNSFAPNSFTTILAILLNIVILLGGFLSVEKTRAYSMKASIGLIAFGGICIARIFWIPLLLIIHYNAWVADSGVVNKMIEDGVDVESTEYLAALAKSTEHQNYIGRTITTTNQNQLTYLPTDGNVRAILAIIFLVAAGLLFIFAGYIGMQRSRKLNTYLTSINQKNGGN